MEWGVFLDGTIGKVTCAEPGLLLSRFPDGCRGLFIGVNKCPNPSGTTAKKGTAPIPKFISEEGAPNRRQPV